MMKVIDLTLQRLGPLGPRLGVLLQKACNRHGVLTLLPGVDRIWSPEKGSLLRLALNQQQTYGQKGDMNGYLCVCNIYIYMY